MSQPSIGSFLKSQPKKRKLDDFDEGKLQKQLDGIEPGIWKRVEVPKIIRLSESQDPKVYFEQLHICISDVLTPTGFVRCENASAHVKKKLKTTHQKNVSNLVPRLPDL